MSVRSGQSIVIEFCTARFDTGAAADASPTPTGTLVVNGVDNAASVTVTGIDVGRYKASVTLPTLAVGDVVELYVAATVNSVAGKAVVWRETKDVALDSSGNVTAGTVQDKTGYSLATAPPTAAQIATTFFTDLMAGSDFATAGSFGKLLKDNVDTNINSRMASFTLPTNFAALQITAAGKITQVALCDVLTTYTGNTLQTGDAYARLGAPSGASISADLQTKATPAQVLTTALTESYASNGAAPTLAQAVFAVHQMLMQFVISSTSYTVKKLDNTATAFIVTLDSATVPTGAART